MDDKRTDNEIIAEVTAGDAEAYGILMRRYEPKLLRYVIYLIHDADTASDVVQDTFIKAYQNLHSFRLAHKFSSWIYRIAHNEAMNAVKKLRHISPDSIDDLKELGYDPGLDDQFDQALLKVDVQSCIKRLDPKYREVIQLVYLEQMKYEAVAKVLGVPRSTVGVWLSRAKKKLAKTCKQKGVEL